jgi:predicted dehydrogenase
MLEQTLTHAAFSVVAGFDLSEVVVQQTRSNYPHVTCYASAEQAIAQSNCDLVYVATPPLHHSKLVRLAIAHNKAVFCEKPLGIDMADSAALAAEMKASKLAQAVNFVFASAPAVHRLQHDLAAASDALQHVHIRLHFHQWPRPFQAHAQWLSEAEQGGFMREVASHFVYLLERVLGPVRIDAAQGLRPTIQQAETQLSALLHAGNVPVTLVATTGGDSRDTVRASFIGTHTEWHLDNWYELLRLDKDHPSDLCVLDHADPRTATYQAQLNQLASLMRHEPHTLPSFDDALRVQRTVEALLAKVSTA